jgi:N6-L-threonylcarbamoyladenine synthase
LLYKIQKDKDWKKRIPEYCFKYQEAIVDVLVKKTLKASLQYGVSTICLSGGVSANKTLRETLADVAEKEGFIFVKPEFKYTTDNAAMIACAGYYKALRGQTIPWHKLKADCNFDIK